MLEWLERDQGTVWKVSKYGVLFGPYFPVFGLEKSPYVDTFHTVRFYDILRLCCSQIVKCAGINKIVLSFIYLNHWVFGLIFQILEVVI